MLNKKLFPFMDADGGAGGEGTQENDPAAEPDKEVDGGEEDGQKDADERKTGGVKSEAQRIADGIVRKRLKGLEKEDIELYKEHKDEFIKFMDSQKSETDKASEAQRKAEKAINGAAAKEAKANAMIAAVSAGIKTQHIEDAVILAMARVNDDTSIEEAINAVVKSNPAWIAGAELPGAGGNPADRQKEKEGTVADEIKDKMFGRK